MSGASLGFGYGDAQFADATLEEIQEANRRVREVIAGASPPDRRRLEDAFEDAVRLELRAILQERAARQLKVTAAEKAVDEAWEENR